MERSTVTLMLSVRKHQTYVLLVALTFLSWAGLAAPCVQDANPLPVQESYVVDAHAHHATSQSGSVVRADESASINCACCGDCASMCPASSCSPAGITLQAFEFSFAGDSCGQALADLYYASPTPNPPFRPPIAIS